MHNNTLVSPDHNTKNPAQPDSKHHAATEKPALPAQSFMLNVEKSASGQSWFERLDQRASNTALAIEQRYNYPQLIARILAGRHVDIEQAEHFLDPTLRNLMPDPRTLVDMERAAQRIVQAIKQREKIAVFGDYDVDGACSSALMGRFLQFFGLNPIIYIPDRVREGYGPNPQAMAHLVRQGATLIITVDCGANSAESLDVARQMGADVVVLDHHQMDDIYDGAVALVNPNRPDDISGQGHLCAAGVVFLGLVECIRQMRQQNWQGPLPDLLEMLDLVALATVCDVVPLIGVNRAFVVKGLQIARMFNNVGIAALTRYARIGEPLNSFHLGFLLGPRINAGGRIGNAQLGTQLLMERDQNRANQIADQLEMLNGQRQQMEALMLEQAKQQVWQQQQQNPDTGIFVVGDESWHSGIVGILASRLKDQVHHPVFALAMGDDGISHGSGRSISGFDLGALVRQAVREDLLQKGGGHAMAAGITLASDKIDAFRNWCQQQSQHQIAELSQKRALYIDAALSAGALKQSLIELMERAGPYGMGHAAPIVVLPSHRLVDVRVVGQHHMRLRVRAHDGATAEAMAFRVEDTPLGDFLKNAQGQMIHLVGNLALNHWNGQVKVQMRVIDAAAA